jgi:hypothetical protein
VRRRGNLLADGDEEAGLRTATVPGTILTKADPLNPTYPKVPDLATADLAHLIPLVIQDKTFVPDDGAVGGQLANTDPTWPSPANPLLGTSGWGFGNLWFTHVYMVNQNPMDPGGANPYGRWDYGPWFWPIQNPNTLVSPPFACGPSNAWLCPGTPNPSGTPESFMDTMVVNGMAYPTKTVDPAAYRFRILNAGNDRALNLQLYVAEPLSIGLTNPGSGYLTPPLVTLAGTCPLNGAGATAVLSYGGVSAVTVTNNGAGYTSAVAPPPAVTISGDGTGATAVATMALDASGTAYKVNSITVTNPGSGYTFADVTIDQSPAGCATVPANCATAIAQIAPAGTLAGITVTPPSTPFTLPITITATIAAPTCTPLGTPTCATALAIASVNTEVKMVYAVPPTPASPLQTCNMNTSGGDGSGIPIATGTITGLPVNCWPSTWPVDGRDGGVPDPRTAGPPIIQIGTEGGLLPAPVVIPSTPIAYEYNRRSITVLNIFTHGLLLGPAERADVVVDFSKFAGKTLILYNDAPAPVPAFDSRIDYYTGDPDQTTTGGAPSTLPGFGPNTRTIMQINVTATSTVPGSHSLDLAALKTALPTIYSGTPTAPNQPAPIIPVGVFANIGDTSIVTAAGPVTNVTLTAGGSGYTTTPSMSLT